MNHATPLLSLKGITKKFPGTIANDQVDLEIHKGEIHALLGENGAGKSTLVKIIYGILQPDDGVILHKGQHIAIESPNMARSLRIGMVFQHFSLFDSMTVTENIAVGLPLELAGGDLAGRIREISAAYGLSLDPQRHVWSLSVGERQRIEIVRCLLQSPELLIMDEPTSVLTPQEADKLFETLERLASEGVAILYISHRLEEIRKLCHKATIMRLGKIVNACDPAQETAKSLAEMMMGAVLKTARKSAADDDKAASSESIPILKINTLSAPAKDSHSVSLKSIHIDLFAGKILGIAGLAGNGQSELMAVLTGETRLAQSQNCLFFKGAPIDDLGPNQRRNLKMAFVPEERLGHGAVPDMSLWENTLLSASTTKNLVQKGFINQHKAIEFARNIITQFQVKTPSANHEAASLSGGNLQKFIMGREILQAPELMIILQPTWGVDAGAATAIHQALLDLASKGTAILIISQDLDEIFTLADEIAVMSEGELSQPKPAATISAKQVGLLMGGAAA